MIGLFEHIVKIYEIRTSGAGLASSTLPGVSTALSSGAGVFDVFGPKQTVFKDTTILHNL